MISMIAAVGKNLELGKNNNLIWNMQIHKSFFKSIDKIKLRPLK